MDNKKVPVPAVSAIELDEKSEIRELTAGKKEAKKLEKLSKTVQKRENMLEFNLEEKQATKTKKTTKSAKEER